MATKEMKLNAIMRFLTADNDREREAAMNDMLDYLAEPVEKPSQEPELVIRQALLELGVPDHIKGHRCLITAISEVVKNADMIDAITGELYPAVAKIQNTTASRVERAIRHAIECAWDRGDLDKEGVTYIYIGNDVIVGDDTGENYGAVYISAYGAWLVFLVDESNNQTTTTHTVELSFRTQTIHPIDPKFLPGVCLPVVELSGAETLTTEEQTQLTACAEQGVPIVVKLVQDGLTVAADVMQYIFLGESDAYYAFGGDLGVFTYTKAGVWTASWN